MFAHKDTVPRLQSRNCAYGQRSHKRLIFEVGFIWVLVGLFSAGCPAKIARVPVTSDNIMRANEASRDGDNAFARKDYYAALIKYLEAGRLNPNNEYIFNRLGITYSQLKFYTEATEAFLRAIGLNPKYPYSVNNLGSVYFAQNNLKKAEKSFKKAVGMDGNVAAFHINLGTLYFEKKKFDKGMIEWRKGLSLDPAVLSKGEAINLAAVGSKSSSMERNYFMARLYASSGDAAKAVESLQQALTSGFTNVEAIQKEPDFDPIRNDERFISFMKTASLLAKPQ